MLPYIQLFGTQVPMYGLMMLTGATLATLFACLRCTKHGVARIDMLLAAVFALLSGLLGAKILYIITDIPRMIEYFRANSFDFMWLLQRIANSGIVFYGGLLGGFFGGWLYCRLFLLDFWKVADTAIPLLPLAHAFGRLGCFCAGCCYGKPMDTPWGWYFNNAIGAPHNIRLFPVQLFESSFLLLILFPVMLLYSRKQRKPGQIVGLYLTIYGVFRFFNEYLRYDEIRGVLWGISTSQWISMALVPIGLVLLIGVFSASLSLLSRNLDTAEMCGDCETCENCDTCKAAEPYKRCAECTMCGDCAAHDSENDNAASAVGGQQPTAAEGE